MIKDGGRYGGGGRIVYDGKRMRKAVVRQVIDYSCPMIKFLQDSRNYISYKDRVALRANENYFNEYLPPAAYLHNPTSSVTTRYCHTSVNKARCPINVVKWTPEGRRVVTGATSGEFTLWNGMAFNFETILQAHDTAVRSMVWSHNGNFMISGDHGGIIKFWQPSLNNLKLFEGHKEPVRDLTFSPTDAKFASCSDDGTIKIWDFKEAQEERCLTGHGWDVRNIHWHPYKSLIASGSKDNLIKLWDPRSSTSLATMYESFNCSHSHKSTIMDIKWNINGHWLLSAGKDLLVKIIDIRTMKELQKFKGHRKEVTSMAWHPLHEAMFATGSADGQIMFWEVGNEQFIGSLEAAHEGTVWSLDWHPVGHILCSGSNDHTTRFWTRNRPGDTVQDRYTLGQQAAEALGIRGSDEMAIEDEEIEEIPGMRPDDRRSKGGFGADASREEPRIMRSGPPDLNGSPAAQRAAPSSTAAPPPAPFQAPKEVARMYDSKAPAASPVMPRSLPMHQRKTLERINTPQHGRSNPPQGPPERKDSRNLKTANYQRK